jgi:hypothetical protein
MHLRTPRLGVVWGSVINYYPLKNLTMVHGWFVRWCVCLIGLVRVSRGSYYCRCRIAQVSHGGSRVDVGVAWLVRMDGLGLVDGSRGWAGSSGWFAWVGWC